jgi:hypothetical protein
VKKLNHRSGKSLFPLKGDRMQKVALAMVLVISSVSLGGCFVGKGKTPPPPPPIVRKG